MAGDGESQLSLAQLLELAIRFEVRMADLYLEFDSLFCDNKALDCLWFFMSTVEEIHATILKKQRRHLRERALTDIETGIEKAFLRGELRRLEGIVEEVRKDGISLEEAFELAIELESSMAEKHYQSMISFKCPPISDLLKELGKIDNLHRDRLKEKQQEIFGGRA